MRATQTTTNGRSRHTGAVQTFGSISQDWDHPLASQAGDAAPGHQTSKDSLPDLGAALKRVRASYAARDPVAAREALLQWGRARWPQDPPPHLEAVARRCGGPIREAIDTLNRDCYTPKGGDDWHRLPMHKYLQQIGRERGDSGAEGNPAALLPGLRP